ncbi:Redox-regulatory protein FAM213A [Oryzias melastigma]|uniref:Peroxiredoxin-like 2A n=1 Tax=Oryzias melastigma TaxID=30732 RepID=A0A834FE65_ORYME|nr:Redox-regulatory protein FAM213A [Oryzias melastigma]
MQAVNRCWVALRWRIPLRCSALPLGSSLLSTPARPHFQCQTALFHQSEAKAGPDPNKITPVSSLVSGLDGDLSAMGMWSLGLGAVGAALAGIFLANTDLCLPKAANASLGFLEEADLRCTLDHNKVIKAKSLWDKNGAVVMAVRLPDGCIFVLQEASELSSLKPQLEELGVPLVAVVKENLGSEIQDFRPHFAGDIYIDEEKRFYGPLQRRMGGLGFIRIGVWQNFIRAWKSGYQGNMNGEGFILGGVYVIGAGEQGILLEHQEKQFGDKVDTADVLKAIQKIVPAK